MKKRDLKFIGALVAFMVVMIGLVLPLLLMGQDAQRVAFVTACEELGFTPTSLPGSRLPPHFCTGRWDGARAGLGLYRGRPGGSSFQLEEGVHVLLDSGALPGAQAFASLRGGLAPGPRPHVGGPEGGRAQVRALLTPAVLAAAAAIPDDVRQVELLPTAAALDGSALDHLLGTDTLAVSLALPLTADRDRIRAGLEQAASLRAALSP